MKKYKKHLIKLKKTSELTYKAGINGKIKTWCGKELVYTEYLRLHTRVLCRSCKRNYYKWRKDNRRQS